MKLKKQQQKSLSVEITEKGFVLWVTEKVLMKDGSKHSFTHWLLDGSCLKDDLTIKLGDCDRWRVGVEYDKEHDQINIVRKEKKL